MAESVSAKTVKALLGALYSLIGYLEEHEACVDPEVVKGQLKLIGQRLEEGKAA